MESGAGGSGSRACAVMKGSAATAVACARAAWQKPGELASLEASGGRTVSFPNSKQGGPSRFVWYTLSVPGL